MFDHIVITQKSGTLDYITDEGAKTLADAERQLALDAPMLLQCLFNMCEYAPSSEQYHDGMEKAQELFQKHKNYREYVGLI